MSLVTTAIDSSPRSARHSAATRAVLPLPTGPPMPMRGTRAPAGPARHRRGRGRRRRGRGDGRSRSGCKKTHLRGEWTSASRSSAGRRPRTAATAGGLPRRRAASAAQSVDVGRQPGEHGLAQRAGPGRAAAPPRWPGRRMPPAPRPAPASVRRLPPARATRRRARAGDAARAPAHRAQGGHQVGVGQRRAQQPPQPAAELARRRAHRLRRGARVELGVELRPFVGRRGRCAGGRPRPGGRPAARPTGAGGRGGEGGRRPAPTSGAGPGRSCSSVGQPGDQAGADGGLHPAGVVRARRPGPASRAGAAGSAFIGHQNRK